MTEVQRRGLRLLNTFEDVELKKKQSLVSKKPASICAKNVVKKPDPVEIYCQHCGSLRSKSSADHISKSLKEYKEIATQVEDVDLSALLCSEHPPEKYWETIAEQRRVALKETLDENMELCSLVEKLNLEIERLSAIASHADNFASVYYETVRMQEANSNQATRSQDSSCELNRIQFT
ncbi:geminin-like [Schistosoma japonicum]|nr:geminin-like [Schistosoma japonicum]